MAKPKLVVKKSGEQVKRITISVDKFKIGRSKKNDLVLEGVFVSRKHSVIEVKDGVYILTDNNSTDGTYINGEKIQTRQLEDGDEIQIGDFDLVFEIGAADDRKTRVRREERITEAREEEGREGDYGKTGLYFGALEVIQGDRIGYSYDITKQMITIGREPQCDICMEHDSAVSMEHARLFVSEDGSVLIADLGSTNKTWVNGHHIIENETLSDNDRIQIGKTTFRFHSHVSRAADPGTAGEVAVVVPPPPKRPLWIIPVVAGSLVLSVFMIFLIYQSNLLGWRAGRLVRKMESYYSQELYPMVVETASKILELDQENNAAVSMKPKAESKIYTIDGKREYDDERYKKAHSLFLLAMRKDPDNREAREHLTRIELIFEEQNRDQLLNNAQAALEIGDYDGAIVYLSQILEQDSTHQEARNLITYAYEGLGDNARDQRDYPTAIVWYEMARQIEPDNLGFQSKLSDVEEKLKVKISREVKTELEKHIGSAKAFLMQGDLPECEEMLEKARRIDPNSEELHELQNDFEIAQLGRSVQSSFIEGRTDRAFEQAQQFARERPDNEKLQDHLENWKVPAGTQVTTTVTMRVENLLEKVIQPYLDYGTGDKQEAMTGCQTIMRLVPEDYDSYQRAKTAKLLLQTWGG